MGFQQGDFGSSHVTCCRSQGALSGAMAKVSFRRPVALVMVVMAMIDREATTMSIHLG